MAGFPAPWWVAGGCAIDLFTGSTRQHDDVDLLVLRDDQQLIRRQLPTWDVQIAHDGRLKQWSAEATVELPRSGLWARSDPDGPSQLQFLLGEHCEGRWWYPREAAVSLQVDELGLEADGIPFVRPGVLLLFKSRHLRANDQRDFERTLPKVGVSARQRLRAWLPPDHHWSAALG